MKFQNTGQKHRTVAASGPGGLLTHASRRSLMCTGAMSVLLGSKRIAGSSSGTTLAAAQVRRSVTLGDDQGYTKGAFTAFLAPYNKGSLQAGRDYTESFTLDPGTFPANSVIAWNWPAARANAQIRGFLAIDYGNYYNTVPQAPIRSSKVSAIATLICNFELSISGTYAGFNTIINFFLTATPGFGKILFEIEVFLHTPNYAKAYVDSAPSVGTFRSASGLVWRVRKDPHAVNGPDILFYPINQADVLVGAVDLGEMLSWLRSHDVITGQEFFNGLAVGIEPQQHGGTATVNALSVNYLTS